MGYQALHSSTKSKAAKLPTARKCPLESMGKAGAEIAMFPTTNDSMVWNLSGLEHS
jgi:hypothetical protein